MLPRNPLLAEGKLWVLGEAELMLGIEMSCNVRQNGSTFHDTQVAIVVIDEDWNATIGPVLCEPWLFLDVLADVDALETVEIHQYRRIGCM